MTQTRDWQKDMEMCEAATRGPWKVFAKDLETLIGTEYDHPQLQAPDSIVGHAYGIKGEYVYIREHDAKLLAEARTALPYWLQEAKVYKLSYEGTLTDYEAEKSRADAAEARELRIRTELESMMPDMWPGMREHFAVLLSTLYPDTPAPTFKEED